MANPDDDAVRRGGMVFKKPEFEAPKASLLAGVTIVKTRETAVIGLDSAQQNAWQTHDAVWKYLKEVAYG